MGTLEQQLADVLAVVSGLRTEVRELRDELRERKAEAERWTVEDFMRYAHRGRTWATEQLTAGRVPNAVKRGNKWLLDPAATKRWLGGIV